MTKKFSHCELQNGITGATKCKQTNSLTGFYAGNAEGAQEQRAMNYLTHRSIRKFKTEAIPQEVLDAIMQAGVRASNTGNMQTYCAVVTTDPAQLAKLKPLHFNQPLLDSAPVHIMVCADLHRFTAWCTQRHATPGYGNLMGLLSATIDASLFAQNIAVAAEEKGLGLCFLGTPLYNSDGFAAVLSLPDLVVPLTAIALGYPDEMPPLTERLPLDAVVYREHYTPSTPAMIDAWYKAIEGNPTNQAFVEENAKETLAQVFTDVRYTATMYEEMSQNLVKYLKSKGFTL